MASGPVIFVALAVFAPMRILIRVFSRIFGLFLCQDVDRGATNLPPNGHVCHVAFWAGLDVGFWGIWELVTSRPHFELQRGGCFRLVPVDLAIGADYSNPNTPLSDGAALYDADTGIPERSRFVDLLRGAANDAGTGSDNAALQRHREERRLLQAREQERSVLARRQEEQMYRPEDFAGGLGSSERGRGSHTTSGSSTSSKKKNGN